MMRAHEVSTEKKDRSMEKKRKSIGYFFAGLHFLSVTLFFWVYVISTHWMGRQKTVDR